MTISFEKQLYDSANAYYQGASLLMLMKPTSPSLQDPTLLVQPAVTCTALSLKLYLKCLLALEGKDKEDSIYKISELYRTLSDDAKKGILQKFDELSNSSLSSKDLMVHLESLDNAFAKWRYIHEEEAKSVNLEDLEEMVLATKAAIDHIKPDW